jgi:hypothetical protein
MLGYETQVVNGQMVNVSPKAAYDPIIFGQSYTGPGMWMRQGVYNVPPVLPSGALQGSMAPASYGYTGLSVPTATNDKGNPLHPTKSPVIFGLMFLIIGVLMLQHIHYK